MYMLIDVFLLSCTYTCTSLLYLYFYLSLVLILWSFAVSPELIKGFSLTLWPFSPHNLHLSLYTTHTMTCKWVLFRVKMETDMDDVHTQPQQQQQQQSSQQSQSQSNSSQQTTQPQHQHLTKYNTKCAIVRPLVEVRLFFIIRKNNIPNFFSLVFMEFEDFFKK